MAGEVRKFDSVRLREAGNDILAAAGKMYTELVEGDLHRVTYDEDEE